MAGTADALPKALARRIRQHVIGRPQVFFAVTLPGLEALCRDELAALPEPPEQMALETGGVLFKGRVTTAYQANLMCRTAIRILMRIAHFKAANFGALEKGVQAVPWERYLKNSAPPTVRVSAHQSRLHHREAVAQRIRKAVAERLAAEAIPVVQASEHGAPGLWARLDNDRLTLSLDSSGAPLYKRGLKTHGGPAPLRETLAAAILMLAGYDGRMPLCDPMCGSGTFAIEAAMMLKQIPPGGYRSFAFMDWPCFRKPHWDHLIRQAIGTADPPAPPRIWASDRSRTAVTQLARCLAGSQLADAIDLQQRDFFDLDGTALNPRGGLVVLNPPYGRRLGHAAAAPRLLGTILHKLQQDFNGWRAAILLPEKRLLGQFPFTVDAHKILHGGKPTWLAIGAIAS